MSASRITSLLATRVLFSALPASANDDASLPAAGQLTLTGSLSNLVSLWIDAFSERQPAIVACHQSGLCGIESTPLTLARIIHRDLCTRGAHEEKEIKFD